MHKLLYILFFVFPLVGVSQTDTIAHLYTFGGNNNDNAEEIEATTDGGYIVIGATSSNSWGNTDAYLLKIDSMCNYEWSQAIGGANNDWGYSIKQTFDKGFIIAASSNSFGNGGYNAVLMKRDSLGNYEWRKTYGGQDWDFAYSVVQTYDSGYVFCGETYNNSNGFSDVYIVKTNPLGDTLWTRTFGGVLVDKGNCVIETSDSNIVVAGIRNTVSDSTQAYVIKLTRNGTLIWDSIYGDTLYENINAIIETTNGDYVVVGSSTSNSTVNNKQFYIFRTNKDGIPIWTFLGNSVKDEEVFDLFEETNGDLMNVGYTEDAGGGMKDAALFKITSIGFWGGLGPTYGNVDNEILKSITVGVNGDYCMAGYTTSFGNGIEDVLVIRLDTVYNGQDTNTTNYIDIIPLTVNELDEKSKINIYPNPTKSFVIIEIDNIDANNYQFVLTDIEGRVVRRRKFTGSNTKINLENVQKGIYIYLILEKSRQI
ncbi:MAG: T9SS type A sorting domain-containing protein, partial [Flavobacteriales bacterium]|nr:T9SS type A sorting domain-containing protein [Flavobacteriales bacterium]